jgi:hypothetical protein
MVGWLRTASSGDVGRFELMTDATPADGSEALIDFALSRLRDHEYLSCRSFEFATGLRERLEARGFSLARECALMARPLTAKASILELVPAVPG